MGGWTGAWPPAPVLPLPPIPPVLPVLPIPPVLPLPPILPLPPPLCHYYYPRHRRCRVRTRSLTLGLAVWLVVLGSAVVAQNADGTRVRATPSGPVEPPHVRGSEVGWRLAPSEQ